MGVGVGAISHDSREDGFRTQLFSSCSVHVRIIYSAL